MQQAHDNVNMETFSLDNVISRLYPMTEITWTTLDAVDTQLSNFYYPQQLFAKTFIHDKIKNFRYFKAGVRMTFRISANRFMYGKLLICYCPMTYTNTDFDTYDKFKMTGYPHILLSASSSETAVFDVPFINNKRAIDLLGYYKDEIGTFKVFVLNQLRSSEETVTDVQVFTTAQFLEPQLFLPQKADPTEILVAESGIPDTESVEKSGKGIISSQLENLKPMASGIYNMMSDPFYTTLFNRALPYAGAALAMVGLSKPNTQHLTDVSKVNPYSDMASGKGIDTSIKLSMNPEGRISTNPIVGGIDDDEMRLDYMMGTPQMIKSFALRKGDPAQIIASCGLDDSNPCYATLIAENFKYYSGSWKFRMYIAASLFHNCRFVLYTSTAAEGAVTEAWQNSYHRIFDVSGDTDISFSLPYMDPSVMNSDGVVQNMYVYIKILAWSDPSDLEDLPVLFNVYKAAAKGFQLTALKDTRYDTTFVAQSGLEQEIFEVQSNPRCDFTEDFPFLSEDMTGYKHENLVSGDSYTTLREVLHRYAPISEANATLNVYECDQKRGLEMWGYFFMFYRGSVRFKLLQKLNENGGSSVGTMYLRLEGTDLAGTTLSCSMNPLLDFEAPYYSENLFEFTRKSRNYFVLHNGAALSRYLTKAGGDDFSFHFLIPPPTGSFANNQVSDKGMRGLLPWAEIPNSNPV